MPSIVFNHLIQELYRKKCSIIDFSKNTDKISEKYILNLIVTDKNSG